MLKHIFKHVANLGDNIVTSSGNTNDDNNGSNSDDISDVMVIYNYEDEDNIMPQK
jgi:hypothetical protein